MANGTVCRRDDRKKPWVVRMSWLEGERRRQSKKSFSTKKEAQEALATAIDAHRPRADASWTRPRQRLTERGHLRSRARSQRDRGRMPADVRSDSGLRPQVYEGRCRIDAESPRTGRGVRLLGSEVDAGQDDERSSRKHGPHDLRPRATERTRRAKTPARNRTRRTWCCAASRPMPGARKPVGDPPADSSR